MDEPHLKNKWLRISDGLNPKRSESIDLSKPFYRYISEQSLSYLFKGSFMLKNPATWWDPYEKIMVNGDYSAINFVRPATYVACFTMLSNGEAHWKMYTKGDERCFRVEFDLNNLIGAFCLAEPFSAGPNLYVGDVSYDLPSHSIQAIGKKKSKYHKIAFPVPFKAEDYIDLLLLKRRPFRWEEESRLILVTYGEQKDVTSLCYTPDIVRSFIKSIEVDPRCDSHEFKRIKSKYTRIINAIPKNSQYDYDIRISRSSLYDSVAHIVVQQ